MYEIISTCKGGGYMYCRTIPKHPNANSNGLYPLHRVLIENKINRNLLKNEIVHHIDGNKMNNSIDNLETMTNSEHARLHRPILDKIMCICPNCKTIFYEKPHSYRLRIKRNKSGLIFCSPNCASKMIYNKSKN